MNGEMEEDVVEAEQDPTLEEEVARMQDGGDLPKVLHGGGTWWTRDA